jgi:hypothetical protein
MFTFGFKPKPIATELLRDVDAALASIPPLSDERVEKEVELLRVLNADSGVDFVNQTWLFVPYPNLLAVALKHGANTNAVDSSGVPALALALEQPDNRSADLLIDAGADVAETMRVDGSALIKAIRQSCTMSTKTHALARMPFSSTNPPAETARKNWTVVLKMLDCASVGVVNQADAAGRTACHFVAQTKDEVSEEVLLKLIFAGADVHAVDKAGVTVLDLAMKELHVARVHLVATLLAAGAVPPPSKGLDSDTSTMAVLGGGKGWGENGAACSKRFIQSKGLNAIRKRATDICVALQDLDLDAVRLREIVVQSCEPFAALLDFHLVWRLVVMVKHFKQGRREKTRAPTYRVTLDVPTELAFWSYTPTVTFNASITAMPEFAEMSFERLRAEHYRK